MFSIASSDDNPISQSSPSGRKHLKIDAILEKHGWDDKLWLWVTIEIHCFIFLENAWPTAEEQNLFTCQVLSHIPNKPNSQDLVAKVTFIHSEFVADIMVSF
jgi:hypothetical protein